MNRGEVEDLEDTCHLNEKKKVARFDDKFTHKPTFKVDPATKGVEVQYPYLDTGKDEYVKTLSFNAAMTYWAEFTTTMFSKAPELKQLTYVGLLDDQPVLKITVTRQEFDEKLSRVQETIAVVRRHHLRQAGPAQDRRQGRAEGSGAAEDQDLQGRAVVPAQGPRLRLAQAQDGLKSARSDSAASRTRRRLSESAASGRRRGRGAGRRRRSPPRRRR